MRQMSAYRSSHVASAPNSVIVGLLYDEALKRLDRADPAAGRAFTDDLAHVRAIVVELRNALDPSAAEDMVKRLASIYDFVFHELVLAGRERSRDRVGPVRAVLARLSEGWAAVREPAGVA